MSDEQDARDFGPSWQQFTGLAWILALAAFACLIRLLAYTDDGTDLRVEMLAWLLGGVICAVFSAACAVLVGIKQAEVRLAARATASPVDSAE